MTNREKVQKHLESCNGCDVSMTDFLREDIIAFWQSRSELFQVPDCFEVGNILTEVE